MNKPAITVAQLRLVVEAEDFESAVAFYGDVLGLKEEFHVESEGGAVVVALQAGRATLEAPAGLQITLFEESRP